MLARLAAPALALFLAAPFAAAQTAPAPKPAAATTLPMTKDGKPKAAAVRKACSEEAKGKGLKGKEAKALREECFARQRPDLAKANACRAEAKQKKLAAKEMKDFMKTCRAGA